MIVEGRVRAPLLQIPFKAGARRLVQRNKPTLAELRVSDEKAIKGSYMGSSVPQRDVPRFLELYKQGKLPVDKLRSGFLALDDINAGFDRLADGNVVRQILRFSE